MCEKWKKGTSYILYVLGRSLQATGCGCRSCVLSLISRTVAAGPMASAAPARSQLPTVLTLGPGVCLVLWCRHHFLLQGIYIPKIRYSKAVNNQHGFQTKLVGSNLFSQVPIDVHFLPINIYLSLLTACSSDSKSQDHRQKKLSHRKFHWTKHLSNCVKANPI